MSAYGIDLSGVPTSYVEGYYTRGGFFARIKQSRDLKRLLKLQGFIKQELPVPSIGEKEYYNPQLHASVEWKHHVLNGRPSEFPIGSNYNGLTIYVHGKDIYVEGYRFTKQLLRNFVESQKRKK